MAFKATSRVTSCDTESAEPARLGGTVGRLEAGKAAGEVGAEPVWLRSTCHVARCGHRGRSRSGRLKTDTRHARRGADHDFSKRTGPEHLLDLIVLLLVRRRRLRQYLF